MTEASTAEQRAAETAIVASLKEQINAQAQALVPAEPVAAQALIEAPPARMVAENITAGSVVARLERALSAVHNPDDMSVKLTISPAGAVSLEMRAYRRQA